MRSLNETERAFAEKHHRLVESFIRYRNLDAGEAYDTVIFGYLRAVVKYHDRPELRRYAFSTIASKAMTSAFMNDKRKQSTLMRSGVTVSLDAPVTEDADITLHEVIGDPHNGYDFVLISDVVERVKKLMPKRHAEVLELLSAGYTKDEITRAKGIPASKLRQILQAARRQMYIKKVL